MSFELMLVLVVSQVGMDANWEAEVDSAPPMVSAEVEVAPPMVMAEVVPVAAPAKTAPAVTAPAATAPAATAPAATAPAATAPAATAPAATAPAATAPAAMAPAATAPLPDPLPASAGRGSTVVKAEDKKDEAPFWQVTALATANIPLSLDGAQFLYGIRGEIDVWRVSVVATFDRTGTTPFTMSETRHWNGLAGASVIATKHFRARLLGGVSALTTETSSLFAPSAGATARLHWKWIGLEGAVTGSAGAFRQVDARAELVLQGGIVELHGGYRARLVEVNAGDGVLVAGPTVALGLSF